MNGHLLDVKLKVIKSESVGTRNAWIVTCPKVQTEVEIDDVHGCDNCLHQACKPYGGALCGRKTVICTFGGQR